MRNISERVPFKWTQEIDKDKFLCYSYADDPPKKIEFSYLNLLARD